MDMSIYDYAYKVSKGNDLYKDIVSEALIYLYDLDNEKFNLIDDLKSYVCKMIYLSWNSPTSPFYRKFRNDNDTNYKEVGYENTDSILEDLDVLEDDISKSKNRMAFEVRLFKMYAEMGSYRKVAERVDIPTMTVYKLVNSVREKMKKL